MSQQWEPDWGVDEGWTACLKGVFLVHLPLCAATSEYTSLSIPLRKQMQEHFAKSPHALRGWVSQHIHESSYQEIWYHFFWLHQLNRCKWWWLPTCGVMQIDPLLQTQNTSMGLLRQRNCHLISIGWLTCPGISVFSLCSIFGKKILSCQTITPPHSKKFWQEKLQCIPLCQNSRLDCRTWNGVCHTRQTHPDTDSAHAPRLLAHQDDHNFTTPLPHWKQLGMGSKRRGATEFLFCQTCGFGP